MAHKWDPNILGYSGTGSNCSKGIIDSSKDSELEPHHQMQFSVILRLPFFVWRVLSFSRGFSRQWYKSSSSSSPCRAGSTDILTLSRHFSLSFIALGRSSGKHPVSSHSCWMYVRARRPAFARPCVGVHKSTSLMSSSLLLQQCPACLVRLTWYK